MTNINCLMIQPSNSKKTADFIRSHFHKVKFAASMNLLYSMDAYVSGMLLMGTQTKALSWEDQQSLSSEQESIFNKRIEELKARENK